MITRYRKRYRKMGRWIRRGSLATAALLFAALLFVLGFVLLQSLEGLVRNPVPIVALLSVSVLVTPFLVAGIVESILTRVLHWRFRRYRPHVARAGG